MNILWVLGIRIGINSYNILVEVLTVFELEFRKCNVYLYIKY